MSAQVSIGEFSVMTGLSRKALRHYHELGLLEPASVDPASGYRHYATSQVRTAAVIRRFRALGMPVPEVRAVLAAPDLAARDAIIAAHLRRMESQLDRTREAVGALRELLDPAAVPRPPAVEFRSVPPTRALAISATVPRDGVGEWWYAAIEELQAVLRLSGAAPAGPLGGLYATELFSEESGHATLFVPTAADLPVSGRARMTTLPAADLAVAVHRGSHDDVERTYGELGTFVTERMLAVGGPVRENYLTGVADAAEEAAWRTEICWPVLRSAVA